MTTLREAAQQALEALEYGQHTLKRISEYQWESRGVLAMNALRAALAQEQEPVAWLVMDESGYVQHAASWRDAAHEHINDAINEHDLVCARTWRVVPAYTAPPQRKPLTEEEIIALIHPIVMADMPDEMTDYEIARAIERAHGIV